MSNQKRKNRFILRLCFNDEPVTYFANGRYNKSERMFDVRNLSSDVKIYGDLHTKSNAFTNKTIPCFVNSWEAERMGEELVRVTEFMMKEFTSNYVYDSYGVDRLTKEGDKYSYELIDLECPFSKNKEKVIYRKYFDAYYFSFNDKKSPPIHLIWKDFNVKFESVRKDSYSFRCDLDEFYDVRGEFYDVRGEFYDDFEELKEQNLSDKEFQEKYYQLKNSNYFTGLRNICKKYLSYDKYSNRFTQANMDFLPQLA